MLYKEYSFRELLIEIVDNRGKTCPIVETGIPLIATNCVKNNGLYPAFDKVRYVDQDTYDNWFRGHPKPGDMIFVCKGSPGQVCWVPDPISFCIAQDMVAIRADESKVYPKYLFALLRSEKSQQKILNMHVGTLIPHFKKGDFGNLYLDIPEDYEYQKTVGDAYFSFCKKIELNRQMNQTLEAIAQALFKSWFVDFEPVKAKMVMAEKGGNALAQSLAAQAVIAGRVTLEQLENMQATDIGFEAALHSLVIEGFDLPGLDYCQPEQLESLANLFPNTLTDSELGPIPEGWEINSLESISEIIMGQSPKGDTYNDLGEGMRLVNGPVEFGEYHPRSNKWTSAPSKRSKEGDLIVCVRGSTTGRYVKSDAEYCLGRGVCAIRSTHNQPFVDHLFKHELNKLLSLTTGSTFPSWTGPILKQYKVIVPSMKIMASFSELMQSTIDFISNNTNENERLSSIRDALLPKLLSGELSVGSAEATLEDALT